MRGIGTAFLSIMVALQTLGRPRRCRCGLKATMPAAALDEENDTKARIAACCITSCPVFGSQAGPDRNRSGPATPALHRDDV